MEKRDWIVRLRCVVDKDLFCPNCTREEATQTPWDFCEDETEMDMRDWELISIEEQ